jgi:hypothetical protein
MILLRYFIRLFYKIILHCEIFSKLKYLKNNICWIKWENFTQLQTKLNFTYIHDRNC